MIARLPGLADVTSDLQIKNPRVNIAIDRDRAAALQLELRRRSQSALYDAFGPQLASTIYAPTNQYQVLLEMLPQVPAASPTTCRMIYFKSDTGQLVPLDAVAKLKADAGPQSIHALRPVAVGDHLVQSEARAFRWARRSTRSRRRPRTNLPATITGALPGHGQGVPGFHAEPGHPADRRDRWWSTSCWACCTKATCIR